MRVRSGDGGAARPTSTRRRSRGWVRRLRDRFCGASPSDSTPHAEERDGAAEGIGPSRGSRDTASRIAQTADFGLSAGEYVTDGSTLFRVEHAHVQAGSGELFVELENCRTLELSVWSADALVARPLRCVTPGGTAQPSDAAFA